MKRWVMAVGENPLRIMRVAHQLQPVEIAAITTPETAYLVPEIEAAMAEMGIDASIRVVLGDAYRWDVTHAALADVIGGQAEQRQWLIAGGTKPIVAAQVSAASGAEGQVWTLDDSAGVLQSWTGARIRLEPPGSNIGLRTLARLHAGLEVELDTRFRPPPTPDAVDRRVLKKRLLAWQGTTGHAPRNSRKAGVEKGDGGEEERRFHTNREAEADFLVLVRALLPTDVDVFGGTTVVLRDSTDPRRPAPDPFVSRKEGHPPRTFEVDGVVIHGFDAWVLEYKNSKVHGLELRKHAAELDIRRRHLGGDSAVGVLATVTRGPDDDPEVEQPLSGRQFQLGRTWHVDQPLLVEAANLWLRGQGEHSRLQQLFD